MLFPAFTDVARLKRELRETFSLAAPLMLGQLSAMLMPFIDTVLAGHLGASTLAAVAVGSQIWSFAMMFMIGTMLALPPTVAQLDGAGRRASIGAVFRQALWLALALGLFAALAVRQSEPLLRAIGVDATVLPQALEFLRAISFGAPALAIYFVLRGMSEGIRRPRPTLYFGLFGVSLLLPVAWALMYGRLGMPALGARGSGMATAIVLWLQVLAFLLYVVTRRHYRDLQLFAHFEWPVRAQIGALLRLGLPMGTAILMEGGLFVATALLIGSLGATAMAGHQIALNVASLSFMLPLGLAMATTIRVGNAVGRNDHSGVRYAGFVSIALTLGSQLVSALLMWLLRKPIAHLYSDDAQVIARASQLLLLAAIFQFSDGIQVVANGALRGLKDTRVPMLLTLLAYWIIGMPLGYLLGFQYGYGPRGLWVGLIAGLGMAAILLFTRFYRLAMNNSWWTMVPAPHSARQA
jgi:MATE family multidrug resistance protein